MRHTRTSQWICGAVAFASLAWGVPGIAHASSDFATRAVVVRAFQESAPGAGDFYGHYLGTIPPFMVAAGAEEFYGVVDGCYMGSYIRLALEANRSLCTFVADVNGIAFMTVHDAIDDPDGGRAEMTFELHGDPSGAWWMVRNADPGGAHDLYIGEPGDSFFAACHEWGACCTDGEMLGYLQGAIDVAFVDVDEDPDTPCFVGLDSWVLLGANGHLIPLALEEGRRVRFEIVQTCRTDVNGDGFVDIADLLQLLSSWGGCAR